VERTAESQGFACRELSVVRFHGLGTPVTPGSLRILQINHVSFYSSGWVDKYGTGSGSARW
jgi:hypothetical protein